VKKKNNIIAKITFYGIATCILIGVSIYFNAWIPVMLGVGLDICTTYLIVNCREVSV